LGAAEMISRSKSPVDRPSLHQSSRSFLFRGSEEDQDFELFLNIVEPMLQFSLDENNRSGAHLGVVGTDLHVATSSDDVVHLVLAVRLLGIGATFWQNIDAGAHGGNAEKFEVEFVFFRALAREIVDMEKVSHAFFRTPRSA